MQTRRVGTFARLRIPRAPTRRALPAQAASGPGPSLSVPSFLSANIRENTNSGRVHRIILNLERGILTCLSCKSCPFLFNGRDNDVHPG